MPPKIYYTTKNMWGRGEEQMTKMIHWLKIVKCDMTNKARLSQHKYLHLHIQILLNWKMVSVIMFLWAIFIFFQYNLNLFVEPHRNLLEIKTLFSHYIMLYANFILKRFGTILCRYFALFSLHIQFIDISFLALLCSMNMNTG